MILTGFNSSSASENWLAPNSAPGVGFRTSLKLVIISNYAIDKTISVKCS